MVSEKGERGDKIDKSRRGFLSLAAGTAGAAAASGTAAGQNATNGTSSGNQTGSGNATTGGNQSKGGNQSSGGNQSTGDSSSKAPQTHTVKMVTGSGGEQYFDPIGLKVNPGDTVKWEIKSGSHSTTAYKKGTGGAKNTLIPEGAEGWDSGVLSGEGKSFSHTFKKKGTYDYFCIPHKQLGMVGRIVVGEPGGPGEKFKNKVPSSNLPSNHNDSKLPPGSEIVKKGSISFPYTGKSGGGGGGGKGSQQEKLHEMGVPYEPHFVGLAAFLAVASSLVYSFYFLKYAESPQHSDQRDR